MLNSSIVSSIQAPLGFSFNRFSGLSRSFKTRYGAEPSTPDPVIVTSNKAYIIAATDAEITLTVNSEISLDGGGTWVTSGSRGTFPYLLIRGPSHVDYNSAIIHTATIGGFEYDFVIWTKVDPATLIDYWENLSGENILDVSDDPIEVIQT